MECLNHLVTVEGMKEHQDTDENSDAHRNHKPFRIIVVGEVLASKVHRAHDDGEKYETNYDSHQIANRLKLVHQHGEDTGQGCDEQNRNNFPDSRASQVSSPSPMWTTPLDRFRVLATMHSHKHLTSTPRDGAFRRPHCWCVSVGVSACGGDTRTIGAGACEVGSSVPVFSTAGDGSPAGSR